MCYICLGSQCYSSSQSGRRKASFLRTNLGRGGKATQAFKWIRFDTADQVCCSAEHLAGCRATALPNMPGHLHARSSLPERLSIEAVGQMMLGSRRGSYLFRVRHLTCQLELGFLKRFCHTSNPKPIHFCGCCT